MRSAKRLIAVIGFLIVGLAAVAHQSPTPPVASAGSPASSATTVRGCLADQRGNYVVVEDKSGLVYVLKGVGNKLDSQLHHEIEVKGRLRSGTIKTGVNPMKTGSSPSDTARGVDGIPLEVTNVQTDIRMISKHCKATDDE
jgi:hypothetical protein